MSAHRTIYLLSLLLSAPFITLGQKAVNSKLAINLIDLTNKTFLIWEKADTSKAGKDLNLFFLFYKDGSATFRVKRGTIILKDSPISWRFTKDSLSLRPSPISMEADGKTQIIEREPKNYFIVKAPGGYLLKGKNDQMLLIEQK